MRFRIILLIVACLFAAARLHAQAYVSVVDSKTGEPIPYAHVCFEGIHQPSQKHCLTDMKGRVVNDVTVLSRLAVSYIGYETYMDSIRPGQRKEVSLNPTILNMKEVVITAQYTPERADKSIYRVNVIPARQIEQKAATNLSDLLKNQLNMRISQDGALGANLSIQGLSGEHIKFLVDGVPLVGRMNGNIDLNQLNLNNVDHVEVIEGPMSVIYGSNALAGVVNIITKENKAARLSVRADAYTESVGVYNAGAGFSVKQKKHVFSLDGSRNFFGGYADPDTSRFKTWKPRRQVTTDGYYVYQTGKSRLKLAGQYFDELLLSKGSPLPPYHEHAFDNYFTTRRGMGRVEANHQAGSVHFFHLMASLSTYRRVKNTYFKDLTTLDKILTSNTEDQDTTAIRSWLARVTYSSKYAEGHLNYQAGIDLNLEEGEGKRISGEQQQIGDYAAFLSLKYEPWKWISLQPGGRIIYNTKYAAPLVYSLSVRWQVIEDLLVRTTFSRGFRSPALKELYLYFVDINHNIQGNPELEAEKSVNLNLNTSWLKEVKNKAFRLEGSLFYNKIDHIITLAQSGSSLYTYVNLDHYTSRGMEVKAAMSWHPFLQLEGGLSRTGRLNVLTDNGNELEQIKYSTDLTAEITARYPKQELSLSFYYKYNGKMPQLYSSNDAIVEGYIGAFHTLDVTLNKGFLKNRLRFSTGIRNVFDNKTIPAVGGAGGAHGSGAAALPVGWGRTWFTKITYAFNQYN